ncbi:H-2 class II histocompatibility antigen, E-S beta chain-like [Channa argus]|uniref:H-2 class II histocompatibility antigen, E-S beta chain-like n=1 Tax=Channa argus TaxID=215402 RepID=UPI0029451659|nr:hypothetical protein Q8A73_012428 [Channa argus]
MASAFFAFSLLFITFFAADGYWYARVQHCRFYSSEPQDIEYIDSYYYNKLEFIRFNSSVGRFAGFTDLGIKNAHRWNQNISILTAESSEVVRYCRNNINVWFGSVLSSAVQPTVRLQSVPPPGDNRPAMLVCSVYSFYPKKITLSWFKNGEKVTSGITSIDELADGDWHYQAHTNLEYTPREGEKISCVVEHASLREPLVTDWDPSLPDSNRGLIAIGASGLILGLIVAFGGVIYYSWIARGWNFVSTE